MVFLLSFLLIFMSMFMFMFSSSFMMMWVFMECSTLGFLTITCTYSLKQKFSSISSYFLIQALGSSMFLISLMLLSTPSGSLKFTMMSSLLYNFSLTLKIGLFPFHYWVVNLIPSLNWLSIFMVASIQKFMPMLMLNWWLIDSYISLVVCMTMLISLYNSLGLLSVKLIFSYSILSHSGWMSLMLKYLEWWSFYYFSYSLLFFLVCLFNNMYSFEDHSDSVLLSGLPIYFLLSYVFNLVSLMGIPPFLGFVIKWIILDSLFQGSSYLILFILVLTSVVHLYVYMRVIVWSLMIYSSKSLLFKSYCLDNKLLWRFKYIILTVFVNSFILFFMFF